MLSRHFPTARRATRGFSLVEALVTLALTSVALLGFAGLLSQSISSNRQAYFRTQATIFTYDMIERVRVNRAAALGGAYNVDLASVGSPGSVAGDDIVDWKAALARELPAGAGSISIDGQGNVIVLVQWRDSASQPVSVMRTQSRV